MQQIYKTKHDHIMACKNKKSNELPIYINMPSIDGIHLIYSIGLGMTYLKL